jgi:23S rRNA-/tRNA-specific pseudouridylate synthase
MQQMLRLLSGEWSSGTLTDNSLGSDGISILYQTSDFLVINKRFDLKVNSNDPVDTVTVATLLGAFHPSLVDVHAEHGFRFVHRLDYATSGCLCIALTKKGARWGNTAFAKRYVMKHYLALVRGLLDPDSQTSLTISLPIGHDSSIVDVHRMCTTDKVSCVNPRDANTTVVLLEHGSYDGQPVSKVLLVPHTGRTHQLRVHCSAIGHCIVGDYTYSDRTDVMPYRMMLHAYHLVVPMKRERIDVTAPDPFLPSVDSLWQPCRTFTTYDDYCKLVQVKS